MGYSYEKVYNPVTNRHSHRLCCDVCGAVGARKYRCPFGYCQAVAGCPTCRKTRPDVFSKEAHVKQRCDVNHAAFVAHEQKERDMKEAGLFVRSAALNQEGGLVKVWFQSKGNVEKAFLMTPETYDAFPLFDLVTPEDYAKHGTLTETPV